MIVPLDFEVRVHEEDQPQAPLEDAEALEELFE